MLCKQLSTVIKLPLPIHIQTFDNSDIPTIAEVRYQIKVNNDLTEELNLNNCIRSKDVK